MGRKTDWSNTFGMPKLGTEYFYISSKTDYIGKTVWNNSLADVARYYDGNMYISEEDCKKELLKRAINPNSIEVVEFEKNMRGI